MEKENIINFYTKNEFMNFLQGDDGTKLLELFKDDGIELLENSKLKEERINYILTFSSYTDELFKNNDFLDVLLTSDISCYYANIRKLSSASSTSLWKRSFEMELSFTKMAELFTYFNEDYKRSIINNSLIPKDLLYEILKIESDVFVINEIINNNDIDLLSHNINLEYFFEKGKQSVLKAWEQRNKGNDKPVEINIPIDLITVKMARKIWNENDIFKVRKIIDDASYCTRVDTLNDYVKDREDDIVINCDKQELIEPYNTFWREYCTYKELQNMYDRAEDNHDIYFEDNHDIYLKYFSQRDKVRILYERELKQDIYSIDFDNFEKVLEKIKDLSNKSISNYIIDYHFEENFYNIMLDMRELLHFYYDGNVVIDEEHVRLYERIANIDYLSKEEKIALHMEMKNYNMKEIFYDDMAMARYVVNEAIKEYSLTKESLLKYKDEELTKQYGVDVYKLNGESFFGLVKSNDHRNDEFPVGHSFSLIGDGGLAVFSDLKYSNTFLYDVDLLNPDQIVHVYPYDSFTLYHLFEFSSSPSTRVNTLAMPDELVNVSNSYNELLILEKGMKATDIDDAIPKLQKIALYCLDEIKNSDALSAKDNNTGILLVNSYNYKQQENISLYKYRCSIDGWNYNYYDDINKDKFDAKR